MERQVIAPSPKQESFIQHILRAAAGLEPYNYLAFGGGIRGGKTFGGLLAILALCRMFPGSRWAIVRRDLPTLRRNTIPSFYKVRPQGFTGAVNQQTWSVTCKNGSEIIFFPESADTDPDRDRWKGLEVNGFLLEEANELEEASHEKAIERAGSWVIKGGKQPRPIILYTFNPSPNWVRSTFFDPWSKGELHAPYFFQPATIADNPFIPESYIEGLKNLNDIDYRRFVMGDWDAVSGQFFPEFSRSVHLVRPFAPGELPAWWEHWGAFDWGFNHPAVFGQFTKDGDGNTYLVDSVYMHRKVPDEQAEEILDLTRMPNVPVAWCLKKVFAGADCWAVQRAKGGDPPTVERTFYRYGIVLHHATMGRVTGWNAVRQLAMRPVLPRSQQAPDWDGTPQTAKRGEPRFFICDTPSNQRVLTTLMTLTRDPDRPDKAEDCLKVDANPETGAGGDDGADMTRYGLVNIEPDPTEPDDEGDGGNIAPPGRDPVQFVPAAPEDTVYYPQLPRGF